MGSSFWPECGVVRAAAGAGAGVVGPHWGARRVAVGTRGVVVDELELMAFSLRGLLGRGSSPNSRAPQAS